MATIETVRGLALSLPRSFEVLVQDRVRFRVGQIVYLAEALIASDLAKPCTTSLVRRTLQEPVRAGRMGRRPS